MTNAEINRQLLELHAAKQQGWGKLLGHLKRSFDSWALSQLSLHGFEGFKMGYMPLLMNIHPEGTINNDLAKKARVTKQAMSKVVKELESLGFVESRPHCSDKRCSVIMLTTKGKKLVLQAKLRIIELEKEYEGVLGKTKFAQLKEMMAQIQDYHEAQYGNGELI